MEMLLRRVDAIVDETNDVEASAQTNGQKLPHASDFQRLKRTIAKDVRALRTALKERDELLAKGATHSKHTVQMSHSIRYQLKTLSDDAAKLQALHKKEASRLKKKGQDEAAAERAKAVDLVFLHIDECEALEKRRATGKQAAKRAELFSGASPSAAAEVDVGSSSSTRTPTETELPDIETREGLQELQRTDQRIDEELQGISVSVQALGALAVDMRDEVEMQTAMIDQVTTKVDKANAQVKNLNRRMKEALRKTRAGDRFIIDFILLVVLLGVVGYLISIVV